VLVPLLLGLLHAAVDATTVSVTLRSTQLGPLPMGSAFALILGYDLVAFAGQVPLGWLTDRFWSPRRAMSAGVLLSLLSLLLAGQGPIAAVIAAGLGNALFHLGAGAMVLGFGLEKAAPVGVFVAPGALGLAFGMAYGPKTGPLWPLAIAVAILVAVAWVAERASANRSATSREDSMQVRQNHACAAGPRAVAWVLVLLLFSVFIRSVVGSFATSGYERTELLLFGIPAAACLGKGLGGIIADRFGWSETTTLALLFSLPLIVFAPPTPLLLLGLFFFQMTMPVTLTATARLLPQHLATAFGFTCLALVLGMLPKAISAFVFLGNRALLAVWILLGVATLYLALRRLGFEDAVFRRLPVRAKE
jgi:MFS transporter, FSR family, fosmidomycin resistance protein